MAKNKRLINSQINITKNKYKILINFITTTLSGCINGKSLRPEKVRFNLLVIFECIYQHLSISKAAALFITPSAVSQSLQRLRLSLTIRYLFVRERHDAHHRASIFIISEKT
jgi:hypothetical protein